MRKNVVTMAIFSYLRDFQYPFVLRDILSNCRHYVSFGLETHVIFKCIQKRRQIEGLSKYLNNRTGKEVCYLVNFCIHIPKLVQSKVVLFRLGFLCCFDQSVYTPRVFEFRTFRLAYIVWEWPILINCISVFASFQV